MVGPDYQKYFPSSKTRSGRRHELPRGVGARARDRAVGRRQGVPRRGQERLDAADPDREDRGGLAVRHQGRAGGNAHAPHRPQRAGGDPGGACLHGRAEGVPPDATGTATASSSTRSAALSTPGKHDGLYWASLPGEPESPLGAEFADAKVGQPYHGYLYKILTAQGKDAPGGAKSYVKNGRMTEGYALVAWPAKYDDTGVMTFIVNQDGIVYQKNLGPNTDAAARAMKAYDPDASWQKASLAAP